MNADSEQTPPATPRGASLLTDTNLDTERLAALRGKRVLLVEDTSINQRVLGEILRQLGLEFDLAEDGVTGVSMAATGDFDLVLMDVQLPRLDGLAATRRIRSMGLTRLPIISTTAQTMESDRERGREAGVNEQLTKPIDPDELAAVLLRWIPAGDGPEPEQEPALARPTADDESPGPSMSPPRQTGDVPGINMAVALKNASNNPLLLKRLIAYFVSSNRDTAQRLAETLGERRVEDARILVHTLKGEARALGAEEVAQAALALEQAITAGTECDAGMERLKQALSHIIEG